MRKYVIGLPTLALMFLILTISAAPGFAASNSDSHVIERYAERSGLRYKATFDKNEKRIGASVEFAANTVQQAQNLVSGEQQLARELLKNGSQSLETIIVFRRPLTQAEFEQFVADTGAQVSDYTLRYLSNKGQRVTINGAPNNGVLIPQDMLNAALGDLQQRDPGRLLGWVQVQATVDAKGYNKLVSHKSVYLIDVSRSVIRAAFGDQADAAAASVDLITPQLYWKLEDLKMVSK